jgi:hypothetical protein
VPIGAAASNTGSLTNVATSILHCFDDRPGLLTQRPAAFVTHRGDVARALGHYASESFDISGSDISE